MVNDEIVALLIQYQEENKKKKQQQMDQKMAELKAKQEQEAQELAKLKTCRYCDESPAVVECEQCKEIFCESCSNLLHSKGNFVTIT